MSVEWKPIQKEKSLKSYSIMRKIYSAKNYLMSAREHSKDNLPIVFRSSRSSLKQLMFTASSTPTSYSRTWENDNFRSTARQYLHYFLQTEKHNKNWIKAQTLLFFTFMTTFFKSALTSTNVSVTILMIWPLCHWFLSGILTAQCMSFSHLTGFHVEFS